MAGFGVTSAENSPLWTFSPQGLDAFRRGAKRPSGGPTYRLPFQTTTDTAAECGDLRRAGRAERPLPCFKYPHRPSARAIPAFVTNTYLLPAAPRSCCAQLFRRCFGRSVSARWGTGVAPLHTNNGRAKQRRRQRRMSPVFRRAADHSNAILSATASSKALRKLRGRLRDCSPNGGTDR
jgi:hypothetical protein